MSVLITGINGFAGSYLTEYLLSRGLDVCGTILNADHVENIASFRERITLYEANILDSYVLQKILEKERPQQIYHLAGISSVKDSWDDPKRVYEINFLGTFHLYEAIVRSGIIARILFASSAEIYGAVKDRMPPLQEDFQICPTTPYAVSKAAGELLSKQFGYARKLEIICSRSFPHIGPKQDEKFVCSNFARQIAEIESGKREPVIMVGNLDAKRDFTDVRDIVRAYQILMEKGQLGEVYNVCSGEVYSIQSVLDIMLTMSKAKTKIQVDETRLRPADIPFLIGNNSKITSLGWSKRIPLQKSLSDILDYWRGVMRNT